MLGLVFVTTGIGWLTLGYPLSSVEAHPSLQAHTALLSLQHWAFVFLGAGTAATVAGVIGRHPLGFSALMALSSVWSLLYFVSWALNGYWRAITQGSVLWVLVTCLLWVLSDWPDPVRTPKGMPDGAPVIGPDGRAVAVLQLPKED